jgi:putative transcription antitermination factor YqgF
MDLPHATKAISSIAAYVREYDIAGIVVGVPRNVDGSLSSTAHAQETWHKQLATNIPVPVVFVDEFSSTQEGQDRYPEIDKDTAAAMVILERFLHA